MVVSSELLRLFALLRVQLSPPLTFGAALDFLIDLACGNLISSLFVYK